MPRRSSEALLKQPDQRVNLDLTTKDLLEWPYAGKLVGEHKAEWVFGRFFGVALRQASRCGVLAWGG